MATFALFNYQFDKIIEHGRQSEMEGLESVVMTADEAFPKRQEIFGTILDKDYAKTSDSDVIHFKNGLGLKEYIHRHLIPPTDDMVVMRVANRKRQSYVDSNLKEKQVDDYQNCIVVIDNRPGIQRMLIEKKKAAFNDVKQVARIFEYTFNRLLHSYSLKIRLEHLQEQRAFWHYASDKLTYPNGFHRVSVRLPYPNLERLKRVYSRLFNQARESFDSSIDLDFVAPDGGHVRLDPNDPIQSDLIKWLMEDAGANIKLYSNSAKKIPIPVGENSFRLVEVRDLIFIRITEDFASGDLFGSTALDEVKRATKTGIE